MKERTAFQETKYWVGNRIHLELKKIVRLSWKAALIGVLACAAAFAQAPTITTSLGSMAITQVAIGTTFPPGCTASESWCQTGHFLSITLAMQDGGEIGRSSTRRFTSARKKSSAGVRW